jgi:hypothetical protein
VPVRRYRACHVDIAENDAAENCALRVCVAREQCDADCRIGIRVHVVIVNRRLKIVNAASAWNKDPLRDSNSSLAAYTLAERGY